jgi:hypothetical protein
MNDTWSLNIEMEARVDLLVSVFQLFTEKFYLTLDGTVVFYSALNAFDRMQRSGMVSIKGFTDGLQR